MTKGKRKNQAKEKEPETEKGKSREREREREKQRTLSYSLSDAFVSHLLREADIMQKVEKGVAKYDRVLRLGDLFSRRKLPLEKKALTEQNESTKALFQHYSSILQEVRGRKERQKQPTKQTKKQKTNKQR
jgi:hypothetical protein